MEILEMAKSLVLKYPCLKDDATNYVNKLLLKCVVSYIVV